jgi:hypothetical protein
MYWHIWETFDISDMECYGLFFRSVDFWIIIWIIHSLYLFLLIFLLIIILSWEYSFMHEFWVALNISAANTEQMQNRPKTISKKQIPSKHDRPRKWVSRYFTCVASVPGRCVLVSGRERRLSHGDNVCGCVKKLGICIFYQLKLLNFILEGCHLEKI